MKRYTIGTILLAAMILCIAAVTEDEPKELTDLRKRYEKEIETAVRPVKARYISSLKQLEGQYRAPKHKGKAEVIREEIKRVEEELVGVPYLQIVSAEYGYKKKKYIVTKKIREMAGPQSLSVVASNEMFEDPYPGKRKYLTVTYRYRGRDYTETVAEHKTLSIPKKR